MYSLIVKDFKKGTVLHELPFYDELNIIKTTKSFKRYAGSYSIGIIKIRMETPMTH